MILQRLIDVPCPRCGDTVRVYAEPGEPLDAGKPPRCPDCRASLVEAVVASGVQKR